MRGALAGVRLHRYTGPVTQIAQNLTAIRSEIAERAVRCGRSPESIELLAISKTFPVAFIEEAMEAGQKAFGENRVQEAEEKIRQLRDREITWLLVGHLQSNKARLAAELFDLIESLDSRKLARKLDRACGELNKVMPVLIQVNIGEEPQKFGVSPADVPEMVRAVDRLEHLELRGLMAIPPYDPDPEASRPYFRRLAGLRDEINQDRERPLEELSMGMSNDYPVAIEEGATRVRVGTAVFGER